MNSSETTVRNFEPSISKMVKIVYYDSEGKQISFTGTITEKDPQSDLWIVKNNNNDKKYKVHQRFMTNP